MADSGKVYTYGTVMAITVGGADPDGSTGVDTGIGAGKGDSSGDRSGDSSGARAKVWQYLPMVWRTSIRQPGSLRNIRRFRLGGTPAYLRVKWICKTGVGTFFQRRETSRRILTRDGSDSRGVGKSS